MYKTTIKDFDMFTKMVFAYQDLFELNNWDIDTDHSDLKNLGLEGRCYTDVKDHVATIQLNKKIVIKPDLNCLALHEVMHIFLSPVKSLAESRWVSEEEVYQAHEEEVTKLTNILIKKFKRR